MCQHEPRAHATHQTQTMWLESLLGQLWPSPSPPGHQESIHPCLFIYFDNTLIFLRATSHFPGPLCLHTTVSPGREEGGELAPTQARVGDLSSEGDPGVRFYLCRRQPRLPALHRQHVHLSFQPPFGWWEGRCEVGSDPLPPLLYAPRARGARPCPTARPAAVPTDGSQMLIPSWGWTRAFAAPVPALHTHKAAKTVRQADSPPAQSEQRPLGCFPNGKT